tara:strand:- start:576 stop:860 length:285 start_codon:yes stop_codon:yes gene_type:complete
MKVKANQDRMGCLTIVPVSERRREAYARHLSEWDPDFSGDVSVFVQSDVGIFIEDNVPQRHHEDLRNGWGVTFLVDPWVFERWLGYCDEGCIGD